MRSGRSLPQPVDFPPRPEPPIPLGISECLLGAAVRYDGSDAAASFPHRILSGLYTFHGICPETGIGQGVPRPPIHLEMVGGEIQAVRDPPGRDDCTAALQTFALQQVDSLSGFSGYVLMRGSPSCGLFRVKVVERGKERPQRIGRGIYAAVLAANLPEMPLEETGRLEDPALLENFVMRTFVFAHWQALISEGLNRDRLLEFHRRYRYLLLAHNVQAYQATRRLVSDAQADAETLAFEYIRLLMSGLSVPASRSGHLLVLGMLQSRLQSMLVSSDCRGLSDMIRAYRQGRESLAAVHRLLRSLLGNYPGDYAVLQSYLDPQPVIRQPRSA